MKNVITRISWFLTAGLMLVSLGCSDTGSDNPEPSNTQQALTLERGDASLVGGFSMENSNLTFTSHALSADRLELSMEINGKAFDWWMDNGHNLQHSNGYGQEFDDADKDLLRAFGEALLARLTKEGWDETYDKFPGAAAAFWADAPCGYIHKERTFFIRDPQPYSLDDDNADYASHVCVMQGETVDAVYDEGDGGTVHTVSVVVGDDWGENECGDGDYACMGRCGAGCSGFGGGWTLDCLEHDACSHDLCASGGSSDSNCGDEYDEAQNDFMSHIWGGRCNGTFSDLGDDTDTGSDTEEGGGGGDPQTVTAIDESSLSAGTGQNLYFDFDAPSGATDVTISISGGSGDADLYTNKDAQVSSYTYDCRPYKYGNDEVCNHSGAGTYYIMINAYDAFSNLSLTATYVMP